MRSFHNIDEPLLNVNWDTTLLAIILVVIGYIVVLLTKNSKSESIGCIGVIIMLIGGILLLPIITWICAGINAIIGIGMLIMFVLGLIILILPSKKNK